MGSLPHFSLVALAMLAFALFVYTAGFSFAYLSMTAATGALLLFGAVQATMIAWGLYQGERMRTLQLGGMGLVIWNKP